MTIPEPDRAFRRGKGVVKVYQQSPFLMQMETKVRRITNKTGDMFLVNQGGEVVNEIAGFWQSEEVDSTKFVKLFVQGVRALSELSNPGTKVFELLYLQVQNSPNHDMVNLAYWQIDQTATPMSESTHSRGMAELVKKGFIAATPTQGVYWVNPNYLWNGDRLAFVKTYVKKIEKNTRQRRASVVDPNQMELPFEEPLS